MLLALMLLLLVFVHATRLFLLQLAYMRRATGTCSRGMPV
jgi:hypothetical protein